MECVAKFGPTGVDVRDDGGDDVGLRFQAGEKYIEVVFRRNNIPALCQNILAATRTELLKSVDQEHLESVLLIDGYTTYSRSDGGVDLTVHLRTDDGVRSIKWPLDAEAARALAKALS